MDSLLLDRKEGQLITVVWQKWRFIASYDICGKIAIFAKPENVINEENGAEMRVVGEFVKILS